jgi:hypothetical protein
VVVWWCGVGSVRVGEREGGGGGAAGTTRMEQRMESKHKAAVRLANDMKLTVSYCVV